MQFCFNKKNLKCAADILKKYPEGRQKSGVVPLLDLAQRQNGGYLTKDVIEYIAQILEIPAIRVYEVASFYTMFNLDKVGKYLVQVCTTTPCWLRGSDAILNACQQALHIKCGQTTKDGTFTLKEVECLGGCTNAPVVQINDDYYQNLTADKIKSLLSALTTKNTTKHRKKTKESRG